ncbi:phosphodiesterase [Halomonas sp. MCCC 1A17488]|uniref:Phosphodiesterase n=1 Tax=Billgrantia sulfidoxydans TaxID=2733484 RepID=A0ABX7WB73_9GAMM|nr:MULTISPECIES: phosphodiesterase [Halomonas]MCE8018191.1 phosphodiesterase [Halomonas sp. MCCC 1A17488]MCG3241524.1 phosphodiesterase [Halomonas sp. MCCC 1A17488]QPP51659.1 phosphodiesterase [Halomonas sp. SS10-MC5]QTP57135.1 phosphodiesterase [Halomonas sulfidoxydans]
MRLVQLSDCHLHADPDARSRAGFPLRQLESVVAAVRAERPDAVIVSGDVSQDETAASYQHAHRVLSRLECPWFWLGGNHDQQDLMRDIKAIHDDIDLGDWRLLVADTWVKGHAHGELGAERIEALVERLSQDERPTLLVMHHPPLPVGSAWLDEIGLKDRDALWQALAPFTQVKAILCGHIHQAFAGRQRLERGEVMVYGCPSTTDQFLAGSDGFAIDEASRPGFRIVDLRSDEWLTWIERIDL